MERLKNEGIRSIPITGRPAGWCDHIARMWPVDGLVGENGAFYFRYDESSRKLIQHVSQPALASETLRKISSAVSLAVYFL